MTAPDTPVAEVMRTEIATLKATDRLDFADTLMRLGQVRHMPVVEGEKLVGMVSHRDLLAASLSRVLDFEPTQRRSFLRSVEAREVMATKIVSIPPDTPLRDAAREMVKHRIGCLPVVDGDDRPIGLVTETDLLAAAYGGPAPA